MTQAVPHLLVGIYSGRSHAMTLGQPSLPKPLTVDGTNPSHFASLVERAFYSSRLLLLWFGWLVATFFCVQHHFDASKSSIYLL